MRVATVATVEGEQAVIRILDPDRIRPKLDDLGISHVAHWRRGVSRQNEIMLMKAQTAPDVPGVRAHCPVRAR